MYQGGPRQGLPALDLIREIDNTRMTAAVGHRNRAPGARRVGDGLAWRTAARR